MQAGMIGGAEWDTSPYRNGSKSRNKPIRIYTAHVPYPVLNDD